MVTNILEKHFISGVCMCLSPPHTHTSSLHAFHEKDKE